MKYRHKSNKNKFRYLRPKKSLLQRPVFWIFMFLLILLVGIFYLFFFFGKFQVQVINVSGNQKINSQDIQTLAWQGINKKIFGIGYKSIFTVDTNKLKRDLLTGFPGIEDVKIQKQWLEGIHLEVIERVPVAVFCPNKSPEGCFFIDKNGVIYETINKPANDSLIVRQSVDETKLATGQTLVDKNVMDIIAKVRSDLKNNFQIDIKEVFASNPLIFTTDEKWQIYFNPSQDTEMQITKMDLLLKKEITPAARKNLKYIYLQYKDRAYYK